MLREVLKKYLLRPNIYRIYVISPLIKDGAFL